MLLKLLKKLIKYKIVKFKLRKNKSVFKFLLYKKKVNTENNEFRRSLFQYFKTLTIEEKSWDFVLKNLNVAVLYCTRVDLLQFIEILLAKELEDEARLLINDYLDFYGTEDMKYQLRTHIFCQENGLCKKEATLDASMLDSNRVLLDCLKGQKVAIVGNGPSELGTGNGAIIDQHKYVVKFNNYKMEGFEEDYGTRVDIWVCANFDELESRTDAELESFKLIIFELDFDRDIILKPAYDIFANILAKYSHKVISLKREPKRKLLSALNSYPTTGLIIIDLLLNYTNVSVDNLFGFSFKQDLEKSGECDHYYEERIGYVSRHDLANESDYLRNLFSQNQLTA